MTEPSDSPPAFALLSVSLVLKALGSRIADGVSDATANRFREQIARLLLEAGAQDLSHGGDHLVVVLRSTSAALTCAFEIQQTFEREIASKLGAGLYALDIGLHLAPDGAEEHWFETTGYRVVTALREVAHGRIAASSDFCDGIEGGPRVRHHERGDLIVPDEDDPVTVVLISPGSATGFLDRLSLPFGVLPRSAEITLMIGLVFALGFGLYTWVGDVELDGEASSSPALLAPVKAIEVLRFSGNASSLTARMHRDTLHDYLGQSYDGYLDLRVVTTEGLTHEKGTLVDVVLGGEAENAGDWLLVRARATRPGEDEELWSATYYRRVSEIDSIAHSIAADSADVLGLIAPPAGLEPVTVTTPRKTELKVVRKDLEDALRQAQRLDLDDAARITSINNLADLYYDSGRDAEAIPLYKEVIRMREEKYGVAHPEVAVSLNNLASLYVGQGRYAEAELLYQRSLEIRTMTLGPTHPRVANAMNNLALLYHRQGRLSEAEELYASALEIRKLEADVELGPEAAQLSVRAARYEIDGNHAAAASAYGRALDSEFARSGPDHPSTAAATRSLGVARARSGDVRGGESLLKRALSIFTLNFGENHARTAQSMSDLGEIYRKSGRMDQARAYHERALTAYENSLGVDHPEVAETLGYLVAIFEEQGLEEKAAEARKRQREIHKTYLGPVFSYVAARSAEQSVIRDRRQDDLTAPRPLHEYQIEVNEGALVKEKRQLAQNLYNMALLYLDLGRLQEAEEHALQALDMRRSIGDGMHPEVAINLHGIGRINTNQERYPEAHARYEGALQIFEATLGDAHPYVAVAWSDLADLLQRIGLDGQAVYAADRARQARAAVEAEES